MGGLVVIVAAAATFAWRWRASGGQAAGVSVIHAIAVLPLANLSGDASQEYQSCLNNQRSGSGYRSGGGAFGGFSSGGGHK